MTYAAACYALVAVAWTIAIFVIGKSFGMEPRSMRALRVVVAGALWPVSAPVLGVAAVIDARNGRSQHT